MTDREGGPFANTDREIWRERPDDFYADSIHVTEEGHIGINCGGTVIVKPVRAWHALASERQKQSYSVSGGQLNAPPVQQQAEPVKEQYKKECSDIDAILTHLGLDIEQCRTDGGWLNVPKIKTLLQQAQPEPAAKPEPSADMLDLTPVGPGRTVSDALYERSADVEVDRIMDIAFDFANNESSTGAALRAEVERVIAENVRLRKQLEAVKNG